MKWLMMVMSLVVMTAAYDLSPPGMQYSYELADYLTDGTEIIRIFNDDQLVIDLATIMLTLNVVEDHASRYLLNAMKALESTDDSWTYIATLHDTRLLEIEKYLLEQVQQVFANKTLDEQVRRLFMGLAQEIKLPQHDNCSLKDQPRIKDYRRCLVKSGWTGLGHRLTLRDGLVDMSAVMVNTQPNKQQLMNRLYTVAARRVSYLLGSEYPSYTWLDVNHEFLSDPSSFGSSMKPTREKKIPTIDVLYS